VREQGGLYVIGTERHESRRIDRQLRGRCSRQGDPGLTKFFLSLEDDLMRLFLQGNLASRLMEGTMQEGEELEHPLLNRSIESAQKKVEQQNYAIRKRLLQYDDVPQPAARGRLRDPQRGDPRRALEGHHLRAGRGGGRQPASDRRIRREGRLQLPGDRELRRLGHTHFPIG